MRGYHAMTFAVLVYVWNNPKSVDVEVFIPICKQKIIDPFVQNWHVDKERNNILDLYTNVKHNFAYEMYLDILPSNLRFGNNRLPRNECYCNYCTLHDLEDEYRFICPSYEEPRKMYIKPHYCVGASTKKFIHQINGF